MYHIYKLQPVVPATCRFNVKEPCAMQEKKGVLMATGTVKFFNSDKGYGFIMPEDGGPDVFVHISALEAAGIRTLVEGLRVSFDFTMDQRKGKMAAQNIRIV